MTEDPNTINEADLGKEAAARCRRQGGVVLWQRKEGVGDKELEEERRFLFVEHILTSYQQA